MTLTEKTKLELFKAIESEPEVFGKSSEDVLDFVSKIWDLQFMPSTDPRFKNAYLDINQHIVNNDDWDLKYLFLQRLNLIGNDEKFKLFIELLVSPEIRTNQDEITKFTLLINPYLEKENYVLSISDYNQLGIPIYSIYEKEEVGDLQSDIKVNNIPFFVTKKPTGYANKPSSHNPPNKFPSFALVFNDKWNDYSLETSFYLYYYTDNGICKYIGETKIMYDDDEVLSTADKIPNKFTTLKDLFCSLGQTIEYYENLKKHLSQDFLSSLFALKDVAFFTDILEKYERKLTFRKSLIRYDDNERILRQIRYEIYGFDPKKLYSFKFRFKPVYSEYSVDIDFNFDNTSIIPNRIFALIGKNGAGKTQLITSLPLHIYKNENECFYPKTPLYSKIIAVSYSIFDNFEIPKKTASFNYIYCGLRNDKNEQLSSKGLLLRFYSSCKKIEQQERVYQWRKILMNFMDEDIIDEFTEPKDSEEYKMKIDGFNNIKEKLSSGQSILLYIITEIVSNIRYDSLLLFDEPETHLHPNAITQLMNTIFELVTEFQSYCIIATHSPLIIRELQSKSVYVIERNEKIPSVRKIGIESFGENLTTLTEEVFGTKEVPTHYKKILQKLVNKGNTFDEIISLIEFDEVPVSLNTRIYLKSLINNK